MFRFKMAHTMKHRATSTSFLERLGVGSFDSYYKCRLLRWAGHVARMPMSQMPRKLLTGWVKHARPVGSPQMTWGRTLNKTLKSYALPTDFGQYTCRRSHGLEAADRRSAPLTPTRVQQRRQYTTNGASFSTAQHNASISSFLFLNTKILLLG